MKAFYLSAALLAVIFLLTSSFSGLGSFHVGNTTAISDTIEIPRPKLLLKFTPPGPLQDLKISNSLYDTTITLYGANFEIRIEERGLINKKKANLEYESKILALVYGEVKADRLSDVTTFSTDAKSGLSRKPILFNGYNACLTLGEKHSPNEDAVFDFQLILPFYTFSGIGPLDMKAQLIQTLQSFHFGDIDPNLLKPSDKEPSPKMVEQFKQLMEASQQRVKEERRSGNIGTGDKEGTCSPYMYAQKAPPMVGGLSKSQQREWQVKRGGFIVLSATGKDYDELVYQCTPTGCTDSGSKHFQSLRSDLSYHWEILSGDGYFPEIGCLPAGKKTAEGENIIFAVPFVEKDQSVTTKIRLTVKDEGGLNPKDEDIRHDLSIKTARTIDFEHLKVSVHGGEYALSAATGKKPIPDAGDCKPSEMQKIPNEDLNQPPQIKLSTASGNNKDLVTGEFVQVRVEALEDKDDYTFKCIPTSCKSTAPLTEAFSDAVQYYWEISAGPGSLIGAKAGRSVVYQAPQRLTDGRAATVELAVYAQNPSDYARDPKSPVAKVTFTIHQGYVSTFELPTNYRPSFLDGENLVTLAVAVQGAALNDVGELEIKSLDHVCTMVDFEMAERSAESGFATNYEGQLAQPKDAPHPDLFFPNAQNKDNYELYGPKITVKEEDYYDLAVAKKRSIGKDSARVVIRTEDGAAWARIRVKTPNSWIRERSGINYIPQDENQDRIADWWAAQHNVTNIMQDDDPVPQK